ncbi:MAG: hypothetical protein NZ700_14100, partial [Gemmataceae bacterium]|nr:hypothetical protein [Gemmataceae bacterium]MDW8265455.1 hypothetical protein [Gemmataceae bacterium]
LAVSGHERILLYHAESLKLPGLLQLPERIPFVLKLSRNGKILLAAGGRGAHSGKVVLFDVTSGKRLAEIGDEPTPSWRPTSARTTSSSPCAARTNSSKSAAPPPAS